MRSFKNLTSSVTEVRIPAAASKPIGVPVVIAVVVVITVIVSVSPTKAEAVAARRTVEVFAVIAIVVTRLKNEFSSYSYFII